MSLIACQTIIVKSYTSELQSFDQRNLDWSAWIDNIKSWTGLSVEESIRTEDRDKWRKYVHGVANPRIEDG